MEKKIVDVKNQTVTYYTGDNKPTDFINNSGLTFADISSEVERTYDFGNKSVTIKNPLSLNVSKSGGHRLFDAEGISHYIPGGWIHLYWKARSGQPHFVK